MGTVTNFRARRFDRQGDRRKLVTVPIFFRVAAAALLFLLLAFVLLAAAAASRAQEGEAEPPPEAGALILHPSGGGADLPALRLGTHVEIDVTGAVARTRIVQAFRNSGRRWAAADRKSVV